jgi:hypothetical protein
MEIKIKASQIGVTVDTDDDFTSSVTFVFVTVSEAIQKFCQSQEAELTALILNFNTVSEAGKAARASGNRVAMSQAHREGFRISQEIAQKLHEIQAGSNQIWRTE